MAFGSPPGPLRSTRVAWKDEGVSERVRELPPRGHYTAGDAGRLAGVSGQMMGQWARNGYIRSSQSAAIPRLYSFQDIAEAMVVHELRDRSVPYREIKRLLQGLRDRYTENWPLTHAKLSTSGRHVYAKADEALYDLGSTRGWQQLHLEEHDLKEVVRLLQHGGWAARSIPNLRHIEVNPERLSGRPTIRGHRIPADKIARLAAVEGAKDVGSDYGLTAAEVHDAERWWRVAKTYEQAA
jgi:uncharacterized protein (DUF433 family)